jgi:AraC-like DNA-binding protein
VGGLVRDGDKLERRSLSSPGCAVRFLDEHFRNSSLSPADLAAAIQLSKFHTSRFLRRATGRGFTQHVNSRRITESQRLLRTTLQSVKEIAFTVGYADCSQLGRIFKRVTSVCSAAVDRFEFPAWRHRQD